MATGPFTYDPIVSTPDEDVLNDDVLDDAGLAPVPDDAPTDDAAGSVPDDDAVDRDSDVSAGEGI